MNWNEELRIFKKPQKIFSYSFISVVLLATLFLLIQVLSPKEQAVGDVDGNNTDSVWAGTLGPAAVNTANSDVELVSNASITQNTTTLEYQAGLSSGQTSGFIRSKTIDVVPSGSLKTWKKIQLGITRPVGTTTTFTVDILCASSAEGCIVNQPLLSNVPLTNDEYQLPASLNSKTKIKVQVNFSRPDTTNPITVMYNWQVHWEINSGVSLVVSKSSGNPTPNTVNPELVNGSWPGVNNNNQVVYTASYSLNRSVQNLKIEIPFPTGSYTPSSGPTKTYNSTYVGSGGSDTCQNSGGGNVSCTSSSAVKATFSLGNLSAVAGSVSVTFKIKSGPPNGVVFKTKPKIYGDDYPAQTLPDDVLNVESRAFATGILISPEYIAASRDFHFIARLALGGTVFQSDMFNARYVLDYSASTCVSNTVTPVLYGSGATSTTIDTANRRVTFYLSSPVTLPTPSLVYGIKLRANSSCNTPSAIPATLTFYSEQDASFIATKTTNAQIWGGTWPKFDSTDIQRMQMTLNGPPALVGAGQLITYNLRINQQTSFPTSDFWAMFRVPNNVTLVSANLTLATLASLGAIPNNWKIYYSTSSLANRTLGNWVELTNGTPTSGGSPPCQGPYGCVPNPPPGQKINWIKWELGGNAFQWDRHANFDEVMAQVSVVTDNNASGTITAQGYLFSGVTCLNPCPVVNTINVNNQPYFNVNQLPCTTESSTDSYTGCPTFPGDNITVASGNPYFIRATVGNSHESGPSSRGDAFNVRVRVRGPDMQYLDQSNPFDSADGPHARCSTQSKANDTNCPNASGVNQNPAPWLDPSLINCSSATGSQCFFEWVIPVIYSINKFPQTFPYDYSFHVKFNVREGVINQTKICDGGVGPCNVDIVSSSPSPQNTNLPKPSSYSVTVASSPKLTVQKELAPGYSSPINYGTATRFRINYRNLPPSTGAVNSVTIIERLPINTEVQPQARLNLDLGFLPNDPAASSVGGVSAYYKLQDPAFPRTSDTPPPKNDPGWISFSSFNSSQIPLIDWVKWERNFLFPVDSGTDDGQDYFDIGLVDTGSPDDIVFTNKAFLLWSTGTEELSVEATAQVRIDTPGFVTTSQGDVASVGKLGSSVDRSGACSSPTNCHTNYLGIAGESFANDFFTSFKDWLVEDYDFAQENGGLKTNYAKMEKDYGKNAVSCSDENSCLNGPEKVVKYTVSGGIL